MKERKIRLNKSQAKQGLDTCEFEMALTGRNMKDLQEMPLINTQGRQYGSVEASNACKYIVDKAYGANTAFLLDGTEDTAPTVIRIVPYGKENEDDEDWAWEQEWNNAPDENEDE